MSKSKNVHDKNQNKKMLIVEDKAINRYVLRGIFEDEYKIAECQDGRVAIELLEESRDEIVAVLLDLVMPVCDGFAVLKYMKETSLYNVPVILISSNVNDINLHKVSAYDIVVDYIQKPFQENIVRQRVQRAIKLYQKKRILNMNGQNKYEVLRTYFGYSSFREGQEELINGILTGNDVFGIMPTGAGKSICYQVPALMFDGITLVISPLISLMKDQVAALNQAGIYAAYLNSSLTQGQYFKALDYARKGKYKIIYVAPERLLTESFLEFAIHADLSFVSVDEAHCVSQWGQDFRPGYLKIEEFLKKLPKRPIVGAFTATATKEVQQDVVRLLQLSKPRVITTGFNRENLNFFVLHAKDKKAALIRILRTHYGESGIVYCITRKLVEEVYERLSERGLEVSRYHAGMSDDERRRNQEEFTSDRTQIMVATNAFGMGIDKPDVRFVVHYNMPKNMESYYQEAGRAGRDGEKADCYLMYSAQDVHTNQYFIENNRENEELDEKALASVMEKDRERLKKMVFYCHTKFCYRKYMLNYFGEKAKEYCGSCGNCIEKIQTGSVQTKQKKQFVYDTGVLNGRKLLAATGGTKRTAFDNPELYEQLRALRNSLAKELQVPAYVIFTDKSLKEMSMYLPVSRTEMLEIQGVGQTKCDKFGQEFMNVISKFKEEHEVSPAKVYARAKIFAHPQKTPTSIDDK